GAGGARPGAGGAGAGAPGVQLPGGQPGRSGRLHRVHHQDRPGRAGRLEVGDRHRAEPGPPAGRCPPGAADQLPGIHRLLLRDDEPDRPAAPGALPGIAGPRRGGEPDHGGSGGGRARPDRAGADARAARLDFWRADLNQKAASMFRRKPSSDKTAEGEVVLEPIPTGSGKGRPTPKRRTNSGPVTPAPRTRKEAVAWQKQHANTKVAGQKKLTPAEYKQAVRDGDPAVLPRRDQGPVRQLARDYVDSRRMAANYLLLL